MTNIKNEVSDIHHRQIINKIQHIRHSYNYCNQHDHCQYKYGFELNLKYQVSISPLLGVFFNKDINGSRINKHNINNYF